MRDSSSYMNIHSKKFNAPPYGLAWRFNNTESFTYQTIPSVIDSVCYPSNGIEVGTEGMGIKL